MDIMVDIETLANSSNSAITQIGAVVFDRYSGKIIDKFKINVDAQSCIDLGMEMNVDTIEWWMTQSKEARESILEKPRLLIDKALTDFVDFIMKNWNIIYDKENILFNPMDVNIWCHATFDEPNLENAFRKSKIPIPWHYRSIRDLRTLVDLANYEINYDNNLGVAHDALSDCIFQIEYTVECINKLKEK